MKTKTSVNFIPGYKKYLVKVQDALSASKGGILLPDTAKEKPFEGKIVAVGPQQNQDEKGKVCQHYFLGDVVLFGRYSGTEVSVDDENYLVIQEEDILGKRN